MQYYLGCDDVILQCLRVYSQCNYNNDGFDIDSRNVVVSDCIVDSEDDAMCLKSDLQRPCENVTISNCILAANCNAIKFGTSSKSGFKNIAISNCSIRKPSEDNFRHWQKTIEGMTESHTNISGIALEMVDGGVMERVNISDIVMTGVQTPIFIKLGDRSRQTWTSPSGGILRHVRINNVLATSSSLMASSITGFPGHDVEDVTLSNLTLIAPGGGTAAHAAKKIPEKEKSYPENRMFGPTLPAYGLFIRHARDITISDVQLKLAAEDARPAVVMDDARGISVRGLNAQPPSGSLPLLRVINGQDVSISDARTSALTATFLSVEGKESRNILLMNSDVSNAKQAVQLGDGVEAGAVRLSGNASSATK